MASPLVRSLEPRLVLNATAELNALGQLLITGTDAAETVELQVESDGKLRLRDGAGDVIEIVGHPDGVIGETNSLDPNAITSKQILIDMRGGDDVVSLQLPPNLDVSVATSVGIDSTFVRGAEPTSVATAGLNIESELIHFDNTIRTLRFDAGVQLSGDVFVGMSGEVTELTIADGGLEIDGRLIVAGDVRWTSLSTVTNSGTVDLSRAIITAETTSSDLTIDAQASEVILGTANDSAGVNLENLTVNSALRVRGDGSEVNLGGQLTIRNVELDTLLNSSTTAQSIFVSTGTELIVRGSMETSGGDISLSSTTRTLISDGATIDANEAQIVVDGGGGDIDLGDGTLVSTSLATPIFLRQASNILLGDTFAPQTALVVENVAGALTQATGTRLSVDRVVGRQATRIDISNNDNSLNRVELESVGRISAVQASGDLDLTLDVVEPITIEQIFTGRGDLRVTQSGSPQTIDVLSMRSAAGGIIIDALGTVDAKSIVAGAGDILIITSEPGSDVIVTSIVADIGAEVKIVSSDDVFDRDITDASRIQADYLWVEARNTTDDGNNGISLSTEINHLVAMVGGTNRGDIRIIEVDQVTLASSRTVTDAIVSTSNGEISVLAREILIIDQDSSAQESDLRQDPELVAQGKRGRIELVASERIELGDNVQLHASQITSDVYTGNAAATDVMPAADGLSRLDRAIYLETSSVRLGQDIEFLTEEQGIARFFGPRPSVEIIPDLERLIIADNRVRDASGQVVPTAFFDPTSIEVNTLEQALVNDANGILTLKLGQAGERGLVLNIDWGAGDESARFQQLYNLSADASLFVDVDAVGNPSDPVQQPNGPPKISVTHLYRQNDILNSKLNGRMAATEPLNVFFAVQHHPSIQVIATEIQQRGVDDAAPGGLLSSTDNPNTARDSQPGLETGAAAFLIPSLSIPMAFIPVREVIPEFETPEVVIRASEAIRLQESRFESNESSASTVASREEYFQLRVLSPEPGGADLVEPEKLPEDVLDGDKIQQLFENLPDGTYEIQYVLGDGNERSILRVEVRGGSAKLSSGDLDEGVLRLKRLRETKQ